MSLGAGHPLCVHLPVCLPRLLQAAGAPQLHLCATLNTLPLASQLLHRRQLMSLSFAGMGLSMLAMAAGLALPFLSGAPLRIMCVSVRCLAVECLWAQGRPAPSACCIGAAAHALAYPHSL